MNNLLEWYMKGYNDENNGTSTSLSDDHRENLAYELGALDASYAVDLSIYAHLTDDESNLSIYNRITYKL